MDSADKFDRIFRTTYELLQIKDIDLLLERTLTEVRSIVGADAGSIYLVEGQTLKFSYTQNNTLQRKLPFGKKLVYSRFTIHISNRSIAGYVANTGILINLPDAYNIEQHQTYSFDKKFDEATGYRTQSILAVPIKSSSGDVVGVIQLINATSANGAIRSFTSAEESIVQLFANSAAIAITHAKLVRSLVLRTIRMIQFHDPMETIGHASRVAAYSVEIYESWARKRGVQQREIEHNRDVLRMAAMFLNVGKIALPRELFVKKDLSLEEQKLKEKHTVYGAHIFSGVYSNFEEMARVIALEHHERWDGTGYPGHVDISSGLPFPGYEAKDGRAIGKRGLEIQIYARIVALANTYDTLVYRIDDNGREIKPDKEAREKAVNVISSYSGTKFDPEVVMAFINALDVINSLLEDYRDMENNIV